MVFETSILRQQDTLLPDSAKKPVIKKTKKEKKDSVAKKDGDTTHKYKDTLYKKDSVVGSPELIRGQDTSAKDTASLALDTIPVADTVALVDSLKLKTFTTHVVSKIPEKTKFIFPEAKPYAPVNMDTMTRQKYSLVQVQPETLFAGKYFYRDKTDWMILVMIFSLVILGWVYSFFRKYLSQVFQSLIDNNASSKLMNERSSVTERVSFILNILFVFNTGFFVFEIFHVFKIQFLGFGSFSMFAIFTGCITLVYLFKYIFYSFIGAILNAQREAFEYIHNLFLFNKIYGVILIPVIVCIPFFGAPVANYLIFAGVFLFVISFLFRMFRGIQISLKINFSFFYLILYLCTVEILPVLILGKFFYKLINS